MKLNGLSSSTACVELTVSKISMKTPQSSTHWKANLLETGPSLKFMHAEFITRPKISTLSKKPWELEQTSLKKKTAELCKGNWKEIPCLKKSTWLTPTCSRPTTSTVWMPSTTLTLSKASLSMSGKQTCFKTNQSFRRTTWVCENQSWTIDFMMSRMNRLHSRKKSNLKLLLMLLRTLLMRLSVTLTGTTLKRRLILKTELEIDLRLLLTILLDRGLCLRLHAKFKRKRRKLNSHV